MLPLWYKNAVIYCLDVETYQDANSDGIGDFAGLRDRLNYLSGLGVTCLWLMPFYPTPNRDDGYDVKDYCNVDSRLGNLGDFVDFMRTANEFGLRVIVDLVINHTSIKHPWFRAARCDPHSRYRNYYLWKDKPPDDSTDYIIFPGYQDDTWTYDEKAGAYYFHRFYDHQAELNLANPAVREEIRKVIGFWLKLGVSGFRVDSAQYLIEPSTIEDEGDHGRAVSACEYLVELRTILSWYSGDAILLAEANVPLEKAPEYFGSGNRFQMMFNFYLNQQLMLSLVEGNANAIQKALSQMGSIPSNCQWVNFLRNHDELAVNQLSESEQQTVYDAFAPDESMRIYDRGIRRRLPSMVEGDTRILKLSHSLLMTLPGTPVLRYGEEIGMGDDLSLNERDGMRTPMQWNGTEGAGYSRAEKSNMVRPIIDEGKFSRKRVNVACQERDERSLLNVTQHMIRVRKEYMGFGWGDWSIIDTDDERVLAHRFEWQGTRLVLVHNFSDARTSVSLELKTKPNDTLTELLSDSDYETPKSLSSPLQLDAYGYRWFEM